MSEIRQTLVIVVLSQGAWDTARRIQTRYPGTLIYGLAGRVEQADRHYKDFGETLRVLYHGDMPIVALCAAGIIIRSLVPLLQGKSAEPPVLAVAEDGSAVVPLLGGLRGVNRLAREIGETLTVVPAITTSGELRFGTCILNPPSGYALADLEQGKRFVSDLLSGQHVRIEGAADWLELAHLPRDEAAELVIRVTPRVSPTHAGELLIYPRCVVAAVTPSDALADELRRALAVAGLAEAALAGLLANSAEMTDARLQAAANELKVPLRFLPVDTPRQRLSETLPQATLVQTDEHLALALAEHPVVMEELGQSRGRLTVIGLGPGCAELMVPVARQALDQAEDVLGYETYIDLAGPFRTDQVLHCSDNRQERQRARHAFELAASGHSVVVVSSGDPGVFAMAAVVLEVLHNSDEPAWQRVELRIFPGVSAALATAAKFGAPLGHDFCLLSLSDNLKPWEVIERRLDLASAADLVLAFYNPISRARPWQLGRALEIVGRHRDPQTPVVFGRDIGRSDECLAHTTLGELRPEQVDMRTLVIIGSSTTCSFPQADGETWVYTPRWYPES